MRVAGKYVFFSTSIILVFLHLSVWIQDNHAFSVKKVVVSGNRLLETEDVLAAAKVDSAESIWDTDINRIQAKLAELPQVRQVEVSRMFPSNIRIDIRERQPVAILISNGLWGIDREGVLLPRFRPEIGLDFPVITGMHIKEHLPGEKVDNSKLVVLAEFIGELQEAEPIIYSLISEVTMNATYGVRATMVEKNIPVYFGKDRLLNKSKKLKVAWEHFASEGQFDQILYLGLRFNDQVIAKKKQGTINHT